MRMLLGVAVLVVLTGGVSVAEDKKIDAKKLVGKWESKPDVKEKFQIEFTKDGKFTVSGEKDKSIEGTYKVDGNKVTVTIKAEGKEVTMKRTISKLTDTEVTSKDDDTGKEDTLIRVKDKKDK